MSLFSSIGKLFSGVAKLTSPLAPLEMTGTFVNSVFGGDEGSQQASNVQNQPSIFSGPRPFGPPPRMYGHHHPHGPHGHHRPHGGHHFGFFS